MNVLNRKHKFLSDREKILCEIYDWQCNDRSVWHSKLYEIFDGVISECNIDKHLDKLGDEDIVEFGYGDLPEKGGGTTMFYINYPHTLNVKELYEKYWV